ncbi:MAG TPA: M14 family zinc carboxypeptidase [bacterium]|nr:M14 family zinc carboxypeptidase [bacterium]
MTVLLDEQLPRTLDRLLARIERDASPGTRVEAWIFEGPAQLRAAERRLGECGFTAVLRSAYKPLVHFFLEEVDAGTVGRATIHYPVRAHAHDKRFRVEAYPLSALLRGVDVRFVETADTPFYQVDLERRTGEPETHRVFAPNRVRDDHLGEQVLAPTGWLRITGPGEERPRVDEPIATEYETIFERVMDAVRAHDWGTREPYFEQLVIRAELPDVDERLAYGEECLSTCEALHEELYFSILEFFKRRAGRDVTDRTTQPGQIVPDIRQGADTPRVRVSLETPATADAPRETSGRTDGAGRLESAASPLALAEVWDETAALEGQPISASSRQGRLVRGVYRPGRRPAVVVTAGQHANETTGVVGALRAARRLAADPGASFAVIPVENPDGYALHRRLCETNPRHMHHAARYTALGDDLQSRTHEPWYEKAARLEAQRVSGARLHVNLHGYPAHEWTRPLTGYLPRGFQKWALPQGFYLILRHHRTWGARVQGFLEALTTRLAAVPGLVEFNRAQLAAYEAHTGERPEPILHGIPCQITEDDQAPFPLGLITEFPDETIYGELFVLAHTVQMETVLAAEAIYTEMAEA